MLKDNNISALHKQVEALLAGEAEARSAVKTTPERWRQVEALVYALLECAPDRRDALLDEACGDDAELRREVEGIFEAYQQEN